MENKIVANVSEEKKKAVEELAEKMKNSKTVLIASIKGLPASQFQKIKKSLRGKAEIVVVKKTIVNRAIDKCEKAGLLKLKDNITSDIALFFSEEDPFALSGELTENQSPTRAKAGDIAPEDISIDEGPTDLMPGPAISELGSVGLQVAVEDGKIAIKKGAVVAKEGEEIKANVADVLGKLGIEPIKVGFIPVAAYSFEDDKTYVGIKIDKEGTLEALREAIAKSLNFAVNLGIVNEKTIAYFIGKAGMEEKALEKLLENESEAEEEKAEEKKEEVSEESKDEKEESSGEAKEDSNEDEKSDSENAEKNGEGGSE
jgi:ribosomal protein L10